MKKEYYDTKDIFEFLGIYNEFKRNGDKEYPFNRKTGVTLGTGQLIIPRDGIEEMVQNKISEIDNAPLKELVMQFQMPFLENGKIGMINKDISLSFRYDKQYKYGDITKSIYEVCYEIIKCAEKTNNFYIINSYELNGFMNKCIINNQWGLGTVTVSSFTSIDIKFKDDKLVIGEDDISVEYTTNDNHVVKESETTDADLSKNLAAFNKKFQTQ